MIVLKNTINSEWLDCPFCGKSVRRIKSSFGEITMFKCNNIKCGAIISFDGREGIKEATEAFNKRVKSEV